MLIEYDGGGFAGWERQTNGLGVQQVLEDAIAQITQESCTVNGSGRTDAGVHARGQVASFTLSHPMSTPDLQRALNAILPPE
ncbi:MAG: tRNA pseudouridine(38-40) synthase TruA, partial [Planctomycetes bacterium]|nr:tRNA pseudouridine(38-40) synthase TruA [Planctomycetota bacterium]